MEAQKGEEEVCEAEEGEAEDAAAEDLEEDEGQDADEGVEHFFIGTVLMEKDEQDRFVRELFQEQQVPEDQVQEEQEQQVQEQQVQAARVQEKQFLETCAEEGRSTAATRLAEEPARELGATASTEHVAGVTAAVVVAASVHEPQEQQQQQQQRQQRENTGWYRLLDSPHGLTGLALLPLLPTLHQPTRRLQRAVQSRSYQSSYLHSCRTLQRFSCTLTGSQAKALYPRRPARPSPASLSKKACHPCPCRLPR